LELMKPSFATTQINQTHKTTPQHLTPQPKSTKLFTKHVKHINI
jgi:hypothetical protein